MISQECINGLLELLYESDDEITDPSLQARDSRAQTDPVTTAGEAGSSRAQTGPAEQVMTQISTEDAAVEMHSYRGMAEESATTMHSCPDITGSSDRLVQRWSERETAMVPLPTSPRADQHDAESAESDTPPRTRRRLETRRQSTRSCETRDSINTYRRNLASAMVLSLIHI